MENYFFISVVLFMKIFIDEAGRGPLAGPVYVGLVLRSQQSTVNPANDWTGSRQSSDYWEELRDSKKLSVRQRNFLYEKIKADVSLVVVMGRKSATYIEQYGIVRALRDAICEGLWEMYVVVGAGIHPPGRVDTRPYTRHKMSLKTLRTWVKDNNVQLVIDGNHDFGLGKYLSIEVETVIKGDDLIKEISIASICAKVERDSYMVKQSKRFPVYGFAKHKGYGTEYHRKMIEKYGVSSLHRVSWCGGCLL